MTAAEGKNPQNSTQTQPKLRWIRRLSRQLPDELHIMSTKKTSTSAFSAAGPWVRDNLPTDLGQPDLSYSAVSCSRWRHVDLISGTTAERESSFKCNLEIPSLACYMIAKTWWRQQIVSVCVFLETYAIGPCKAAASEDELTIMN